MKDICFRWLGVAGIELEIDHQILAIDPLFTRLPLWYLGFGRPHPNRTLSAEKMPHCDTILITHAHWDHLIDTPEITLRTGAPVFGSANTCQLLQVCGVPTSQTHQVQAGDRLSLGEFQVEVLPAQHMQIPFFSSSALPKGLKPPLRLRDYRLDNCFSFLIQAGGLRLLDWCGVRTQEAVPADILFVHFLENFAYYKTLLEIVKPRTVVPTHWDNFFRPLSKPIRPFFKSPRWAFPPLERSDPAQFRCWVRQIDPHINVLLPEIFRPYPLSSIIS